MAERLGSGSLQRLPTPSPRGCPRDAPGVQEGPDPGRLRCCREPAAASFPLRGFLLSPEAGGTPLRLSERDRPSPPGRPTRGRSGTAGAGDQLALLPAPRPHPRSLCLLPPRPIFLLCVSQSLASQMTAPGLDPALSLTKVPASLGLPAQPGLVPVPLLGGCQSHPAPQPICSPIVPIQHQHHAQHRGAGPSWPEVSPGSHGCGCHHRNQHSGC